MSNNNHGQSPTLKPGEIITHLKKCQSTMGNLARDAFLQYLRDLNEAFLQAIDQARSNQEVAELSGIQRLFTRNKEDLIHYYCGYIAEGFVKFKKKELRTDSGNEEGRKKGLSLLDNEELEETIAISTITQKVDAHLTQPLWALNQRFAVLNGGDRVTESSNPASPIQFCESLRKALRLIPLTPRANAIAYKTFEVRLFDVATQVANALNEYLASAGILPDLQYNQPQGAGDDQSQSRITGDRPFMGDAAGPDGTERRSSERNQAALLQEIRSLQNTLIANREQIVAAQALNEQAVAVFTQAQMMNALDALRPATAELSGLPFNVSQLNGDGGGSAVPVGASNVADSQALLQGILQQLASAGGENSEVAPADMHTIDLVGMVFEYMLSDENIPDSVKALLSFMHTPFLKLAFLDPGFFERPEHPARLLLNQLAEAGSRWVGNDGSEQHNMLSKIKAVVDRVLKDFTNDVSVISDLLDEFSAYTKKLLQRQELMEKRAAERAQGEERLREVKIRVNTEVLKRTEDKELPSPVLLFALQPWSDYLSFALLRYGEESDKWKTALGTVDNVLWAIEPKSDPEEIAQQAEMVDSLIADMSKGFDTIGYDQVKGANLIDAIKSLIQAAMEQKKAEPAPAPMRDELEKVAAEKAGTDLSDTRDLSEEEQRFVEHLKMIEFGTWFEFDGGKRLKVAWFNARTSNYMLVDQKGKKVAMMPGIELAREVLSKRAKIISGSSKPFFERALENIFQKLNAEAAGGSDTEEAPA